ncbi:unnamed protein product [Amoebophrya sp. A25]|nr:unnamed protein product [Amoebophrya sp. A25]|eukprot:GSA25T00001741001.1
MRPALSPLLPPPTRGFAPSTSSSSCHFRKLTRKKATSRLSSTTKLQFHQIQRVPADRALQPQRRFFSLQSWHDEVGALSLSERQEGFLLSRLPPSVTEAEIVRRLESQGVTADDVLLMRSRLGKSTGRALVRCEENIPHVTQLFGQSSQRAQGPADGSIAPVSYRPLDRHDIRLFVEQVEAYLRFSEDLHYLARPEHLLRTVTIHNVPRAYGRKDLAAVLHQHCKICVAPHDVIFNMKRFGVQGDTAFVVCGSEKQARHVISTVQELAVPKHAKYATLFGCSFLYADRSCLFWGDREGRYDFEESRFQLYTQGWDEHLSEDEFKAFLNHLKFFPDSVRKVHSALPLQAESKKSKRQGARGKKSEDKAAGTSSSCTTKGPFASGASAAATSGSPGLSQESAAENVEAAITDSEDITEDDVALEEHIASYATNGKKQIASSGFLLEFPNMRVAKSCFSRMRRMKRRWQMPAHTLLYAYPKPVDVHWAHETKYKDEIEQDWELTEPIVY